MITEIISIQWLFKTIFSPAAHDPTRIGQHEPHASGVVSNLWEPTDHRMCGRTRVHQSQ